VSSSPPETPPPTSLAELARLFLRLGCTAFGGPAAHLTLMQKEAVEKRRWMNQERFLDLVGACNLLPGPGSTQVAMALGFTRRRWPGLLISGVCFILPASLSTLALAWAYARFGGLHLAQGLLYAAKPVMLAILAQAIWVLGRSAWRALPLAALGIVCGALAALGVHPLLVLLGAGGYLYPIERMPGRTARPANSPQFSASHGLRWRARGLSPGALAFSRSSACF